MRIETSGHLIDQIDAPVLLLDEAGIVLHANQELLDLLGCESDEQVKGAEFGSFLSSLGQERFQELKQSFPSKLEIRLDDTLTRWDQTRLEISLTGRKLLDPDGFQAGSVWTIQVKPAAADSGIDQAQRGADLDWLAEQARDFLSIRHGPEIVNAAGQALQEKLGSCVVAALTKIDANTLRLEGISGLEDQLLARILDLIGADRTGRLFPIDDRYQETYSTRRLYHHTASLEDFASSYVPRKISRQLERMVNLTDIYTIGLQGNQEVMGCFYIFSLGVDLLPQAGLVESFSMQVALALEKTKYSEDLLVSERQFQTIFEYAPDAYYLSDLKGNFLDGNLSAEKITGFQRAELIGRNFLNAGLLSKDQLPKAAKLLAQNLLGKSTGPDEFELTRKDQTRVRVEISTHPVMVNDNPVVLGIARDVTNRKLAEETLAKSHDTLTRVLEGIDAHVYVADLESFEILYMNKKMIEDFGGDFTGKLCYQSFRGEKQPCPFCHNTALLNATGEPGEEVVWESQSVKDGRWFRNYDRAIFWTDRRIVRLQIAVDISDQKAASEALVESEERYRYLFQSAHDALMTLEPPDWLFTSGNPALVKMFALENEAEFLAYKPWDLSPEFQPDGESSRIKAQRMIEIAIEKGSHYFRWTHKRVTGEEFLTTVQLTRVQHGPELLLQATVREITEQVAAELKLQQQMDDLALINRLNTSANQGASLEEIIQIFSVETKRIFGADYSSVFLIKSSEDTLLIDPGLMSPVARELVEKLTSQNDLSKIELDLGQLELVRSCLRSGAVKVMNQAEEIQQLMAGLSAATRVTDPVRKGMRKRFLQLVGRENLKAAMLLPLVASNNHFGVVLVTGDKAFPEQDQSRLAAFTEQLSGVFHRIQSDRGREDKIAELELIYQTFLEGSRIDDINGVCQHIADKILEVNPECYVLVSLFDPESSAIRVRGMSGLGNFADRLFKLLGIKPSEFQVNTLDHEIDSHLNRLFTSGKLVQVPGGLYDLSRGTIPLSICSSAERLAGVEKTYFIGFSSGIKSSGGIILFAKAGATIHYPAAIETIASHFSAVFERRQIQMEALNRKAQLEALRDIELDIVSHLNLKELLFSISEKAVSIVDAVASGFSVYDPDRDVLEFMAYSGYDSIPENANVIVGEGLAGRVWQNKETLIVKNYQEWEGRAESWVPFGNYYLAGIPVCWGEEILGVLEIALAIGDELSPADIEILELFATQAAIAIKNARLFSEEQLRREEAETLREGGMLINQMTARPELLDMILTALQRVVPYSRAYIQLVQGAAIAIEAQRGEDQAPGLVGSFSEINASPLFHKILFEGTNIVLNTREEIAEHSARPVLEGDQSWLAVPLEIKGNRFGLITLTNKDPFQFSQWDAGLVRDFANQAAIAIENNRLFEELRRRTREIEVVYQSALALTQELKPENFLEHLHDQVAKLFTPDVFLLASFDQHSKLITIDYAREGGVRMVEEEGTAIQIADKNSLLSWIIRKKTPLLIRNAEVDSLPVQPRQQGKVIRSFLGVPLMAGERTIGALVVQAYDAQAYNQDHRRLLQLLGNQVAIALENSRLFEDAQRRLSKLASLREIDQAISGSLDLEQTMDVIIHQLIRTLNVDAACVLSFDPLQDTLDHVSSQGFWTNSIQRTSLPIGKGLAGEAAVSRSLVHIPDMTVESTSLEKFPHFNQEKFVTYFAYPLVAKGELVGVLEVFHRSRLDPDPEWINFLDALAKLAAIAIDRLNLYNNLARSNIELKQAYDATIEGWAKAIELRDGDTEGHSRRVASIVLNLARKMGVKGSALTHIRRGALLHDIGKIAIPDAILLNSGDLSAEEWDLMKKHPTYAYSMLSEIDYLLPALDIPYCHHERWDGSGYPRGLSGKDIPLPARIFAVVDVWDALQSDRPYRKSWSEKKAIQYLRDQSGKEFDPQVVSEFLELIGEQ